MKMLKFNLLFISCFLSIQGLVAQKQSQHSSSHAVSVSSVSGYGHPQTISEVTDILENSVAYKAVKELIENDHITIIYKDNTFRGNAYLNRGDFVVSFNSALEAINEASKMDRLDTVLVNTYDRNKAYITSVTQIKDIKPGSIYYIAVQSLLEKWGINAPFTKSALLNARSRFYEDELYDILRVTIGYHYALSPKRVPVTRNRFAIILEEAVSQKMRQIDSISIVKKEKTEAEKARVNAIINKIEQNRRDSITREIEGRKAEAQKKEAEARKKLEDKDH